MILIWAVPVCARVLHVSPDGTDADGLSWETAHRKIQDAIVAAASGDSIWIRKGTYREAIGLKDGLSLYGGFAGTEMESEFHLRDPNQNVTTLNALGSNSRVVSIQNRSDVVLDGLQITGGRGVSHGAGVYIADSTLISVVNCRIFGNVTSGNGFTGGAGIYVGRTQFLIEGCTISTNLADEGCGIYLASATGEIRDCLIQQNSGRIGGSGTFGGGLVAGGGKIVVTNCTIDRNTHFAFGGGLSLIGTDAEIIDSRITNNQATNGAGLHCSGSEKVVLLKNCIIDGNIADGQLPGGGGINSRERITIEDCTITNNVGGYNGGGIYSSGGKTQIKKCLIEGNRAREGGGISLDNFSEGSIIQDTVLKGNRADSAGGGLFNGNGGLVVDNCKFIENTAIENGGGILSFGHRLIRDSIVVGNTSGGAGGGIAAGFCILENCLIYRNSAESVGGGLAMTDFEPSIKNCVFFNNFTDMPGREISVGILNGLILKAEPLFVNCIVWNETSENLIYKFNGANPLFRYCDIRGGWVGEGNIDADPLFVDPDKGDFHLGPSSPCIDSASSSGPITDIEGNLRPVDVMDRGTEGPGAFDMGAYEFQIPLGDLNSNGVLEALDLFLFGREWMKETDSS